MKPDVRPRGSGSLASGERDSGRLRVTPAATEPTIAQRAGVVPEAGTASRPLTQAEFNTAIVHFYRGEVQRSNTWRNRLDTTTNWAVITAGATLSFAFSSTTNPHFVIPINSLLIAIFLLMEARRYRYYEIWSNRVRMIETGYFAHVLAPDTTADKKWAEHLAADLITPHFTISQWEAIGRRLRRNYLWIFALLAASWNLKVYLHPTPAKSFADFLDRATTGVLPGWIIFIFGVVFNAAIIIFALATLRLREATGEVLPHHEFSLRSLGRMTHWTRRSTAERQRATVRRAQKARERVRTTATASTTGEFRRPERTDKTGLSKDPAT